MVVISQDVAVAIFVAKKTRVDPSKLHDNLATKLAARYRYRVLETWHATVFVPVRVFAIS